MIEQFVIIQMLFTEWSIRSITHTRLIKRCPYAFLVLRNEATRPFDPLLVVNGFLPNQRIIEGNGLRHILQQLFPGEIVRPRVSVGVKPKRILRQKRRLILLVILIPNRDERIEEAVALVDPVVLLVRRDLDKLHLRIEHGAHVPDNLQLLLARKIVADVAVVDAGATMRRFHRNRPTAGRW